MNKNVGCTSIIIRVLISLILIIGYVKCVIKLVNCDFEAPYKAEVIYGIGTCTGLGAIFGYINIPDGKQLQKTDTK